ncbi:U11/U12 small nuclear ribonucleoprotein 35 kDa protein-like [Rhodnius prolixus]|uniref:U11/U12 small nuclear ribonucleoprotein 35 kDa protein n=1 Tax=Rhodnius prolixus TaxID=13249 RepID=A0A4P6DBI3_RHOPR
MSSLAENLSKEDCEEVIGDHAKLIKQCWCPRAIIYDPLKAGSIDGTDSQPHDRAIMRAQNADYKPNKNVKGDPECTIFVARLHPKTTVRHLKEVFSRFGDIVRCRVVEDLVTGRSRGYAFVEFTSSTSALMAYKRGNKTIIDGSEVFVDMECERLLPGWVPRRLGGGFNGKKESGQLRFGGRERPFRKPIKLLSKKELIISLSDKLYKPKDQILKESSVIAARFSEISKR